MKRAGQLMGRIADPDNLRLAFWKARKGKTYATGVAHYRVNLDENLSRLREQLLSGEVDVGKYHYFKIYEPKERKICAAAFDEQVLHHALMQVCDPCFERLQIFDSYATRRGKGTHAALERAKKFTHRYEWFLKLDVRKFFDSIHHGVVQQQVGRLIKDGLVLHIFSKILDSYHVEPGRGLPIGNLTSQYFANHYPAGLDHFIKENLRIGAYVRYMDDMVLWHNDKEALKTALPAIRHYVASQLLCDLKPVQLNRTTTGLPFLGYHVFPHHLRLLQQSKQRYIRKLALAETRLNTGEWSEAAYQRHVEPLLAFTQHADVTGFHRKILQSI